MTARSWPLAGQRVVGSSSIATFALFGRRFEHHHRFAGKCREIDRALPMRRILAHRRGRPTAVPGRGGDVVAVARIFAAQRPIGALDDPLGAFDDSVERRAQHFVERMVERRPRELAAGCSAPVRLRPSRGSRRSCRRRQSRPRRSGRRNGVVGAAARALAGKAAAGGERADQRHFASFILFEPKQRESAAGPAPRPSRRQACSAKLGRKGDDPQLLVGRPFVAGRRSRLRHAAAEHRREPRALPERARSSLRASSAISSPSGVALTHSSMS